MHTKHIVKAPPQKTETEYKRIWRIVDGAVKDALAHHPNYIDKKVSHRVVRNSINKRVVGAIRASLRQANGRSNEGLK